MTKRDPIDEIELEQIARDFIRTSLGGPDSELAGIRERNLRAYNAMPEGEFAPPDIDDRSTFVSSDVADTVDGMLPQLLDVFVSDDKAVECEPKKPGPQAQKWASDATGYLNHLFYVRNEGLNVLHDWIQDAALQKVGFVKVWAEEEAEDSKQTYEGQTQEQLAALMMDGAQLAGEPEVDEKGGLTFTVVDESKRMKFCVACTAAHNMRVDANAKWGDEPAMIGEVLPRRRFELEEMGYDLSNIGGDVSIQTGEADALLGDGQGEPNSEIHESHKLYEYAELYLKLDVDGDGVAEWVQVCLINGTLVHQEQVDDHPYAEICLMPRAHAYFGDCPADRAFLIQKEQTNLSRALFDNVYFSVNQRTYINTEAQVNIGDLLDNRPGGIVRGQGSPRDAFAPIPTEAIPATTWQMQEWLSTRLENRTGFTRYSQGMDADSLNKTATGINIITSKADMRLRLMTRFAAQGIRKMFAKLLKLATKHQNQQDWFQVNGQWNPVMPTEWRDQFNIKINVGLGHGTREQKMQAVMAMLPLQQFGVQMGVVRPEHIASTIRLAAQVNEFKNPDEFADPKPTGLPNPEQFQQMQQQMQETQQQLQQLGQENAQLKLANANKQGELQIRAMEVQSKHAIESQPEAAPDNSLEWAKVRVSEFDAVTKRMALGINAEEAEREFVLQHAIAAHDASMDIAAHQQADDHFTQQAAADAAQATEGPAAPGGEA
jgi:hypothetical protein